MAYCCQKLQLACCQKLADTLTGHALLRLMTRLMVMVVAVQG
jgi:hypothetical protein